jgi:thiamine-phosphate pyrophosphorylase
LNTFAQLTGRGLYAITNGPRHDLLEAAEQALAGGAQVLQYRDESNDTSRRLAEATALKRLCDSYGIPLIIEQDIALAQAVSAHGVHLGNDEDDIGAARALLGNHAIIGVSCRDSLQRARAAAQDGAGYISFGACFASPTKPLAPRASIELLGQSAAFGVPRVAIGGITPDNGAALVAAGADFLASISTLFGSADVRATARRFAQLYSSPRGISA